MKAGDSRDRKRKNQAFSLIEVVLALGIVGAVLIPMMAALSQGVSRSGKSTDRINEARIIRHLAGIVQQANWGETNDLRDFESRRWYFDDRANVLSNGDSPDRRIYVAKITVEESAPLPGASVASPDMRQVKFEVSSRVLLPDPFSDPRFVSLGGLVVSRQDALKGGLP